MAERGSYVPRVGGRDADYIELSRQVRGAGLLERRARRYALRLALNAALVVGGWTAFVLVGNSWYVLVVAAFLAVMFAQTGFIGHDAGHRQISASPWVNHLVGMTHANLGIGMSYGYWVDKHNRHHAHPNQVGRDPDVGHGPIAWTREQALAANGPVLRGFARRQGVLFFPITLLESFNMHVRGLLAIPTRVVRYKRLEATLLVTHFAAYLTAIFLVLSPLRAVVFLVVQQGLMGLYLGCAFAPNHKGMPMPAPGTEPEGFARRQILTARNVSGGRFVNFAFGGLNYQIEHHLFPTMPMRSLRRVQPMVKAFCAEQGLPYVETTALGSYRLVVRYLHAMGAPLRPGVAHPEENDLGGVQAIGPGGATGLRLSRPSLPPTGS